MAGTPGYKIYDDTKRYVAAVRDPSLAAALIGAAGFDGWSVKFLGRIVWREGKEATRAAESYDAAAETMSERIRDRYREQWRVAQ